MSDNIELRINFKRIIRYIMLFLLFTICMFDFGPNKYQADNNILLHVYVFSYFIALYCGFKMFSKKRIFNKKEIEIIYNKNTLKIEKILKKGVYINFILMIIFCFVSTGSTSIGSFFSKILGGINDPAATYYDKVFNSEMQQGANILNVIFMFIYPYILSILVLSIYNFKKLNSTRKIICALTIILEISRWVAMGTNKGVFDILILFISLYLLKTCYNENNKKKNKIKLKYKILIIIGGISAFFMFTYFISSRMYVKNDNLSTGEKIYYGIEKMTNYIVQGYKGMDYALNLEWQPTFGVGNSMFLTSQVDHILGTNLSERTYAKRAEVYGWSSTVNWHTAYTWFANDIHFIGIIPLMFFIGAFLAILIKEIILYNNYFSAVLYYMIIIGIFYLSANNQVLAFSNMCIAFITLFILRQLKVRRDRKYKWRTTS